MAHPVNESTKPPLSNKGGNTLDKPIKDAAKIAVNLDWLRYSAKYDTSQSEYDNLLVAMPRHPAFHLTGEMLDNARGYDRAMQLSIGVIHWHSERPEQGVSVELSGSALAASRDAGAADLDLLHHVSAIDGNVSTMDAAIDLYNMSADAFDVIRSRDDGTIRTTASMIGTQQSTKRTREGWLAGDTVYIGSPKSDRQVKIYNKAAEQGIAGKDWTRIEMRWRGRHARAAHSAMLLFGIGETVRKAVLSMVQIPYDWFHEAMNGNLADIEPTRRKETNTKDWLLGIVLGVLERELMNERAQEGTELFDAFDAILKAEFNARGRLRVRVNGRKAYRPRDVHNIDKT